LAGKSPRTEAVRCVVSLAQKGDSELCHGAHPLFGRRHFELRVVSRGNLILITRDWDSETLAKFPGSNWSLKGIYGLHMTHYGEGALCHLPGGVLGLTHHFPLPVTSPTISKLICKAFSLPALAPLHLD